MTEKSFGLDSEIQNGQESGKFEPRWWWWAALIGLILGWIVGLNVKPDVEDLHRAALELVPPSAEIAEESVVDKRWILFTPAPPLVHLKLISDSTPEQLVEEISTKAERSGWRVSEPSQNPGAISLRMRKLLFEDHVRVWRSGFTEFDASIGPWVREDVGKIITASASLAAGILAAIVVGVLAGYRRGKPRVVRHAPLRWWHLLGVTFVAFVFWQSLHFVI